MKVIAMYLPQFYRTPENDAWWGDGFTDWVSTRNAKPIFAGHYQPHIPANQNYYNLLEKEVMKWQEELMHKFEIDGMCMYHYWFKEGKQILEKPVDNLLQWKDINMPFCLYWANETWARSWGNISGTNSWGELQEKKVSRDGKAILLEQGYGDENDWRKHFEYLLPFFKDKRYIKIDNKPVFLIYKSKDVMCLDEMLELWRRLAIENGLEGIYVIGARPDEFVENTLDAILFHEPAYSLEKIISSNDIHDTRISYDDFWHSTLSITGQGKKTYYSGIVRFDDTPRRGNKGWCLYDANPNNFEKYMTLLMAKSKQENNELVFVNAWNEWGEGMHLEPDEKYGYQFLEAVKNAKNKYASIEYVYPQNNIGLKKMESTSKFEKYMNSMEQWMTLREENVSITQFLQDNNYFKVAIYGYGMFGRHLLKELENCKIEVVGVIDRQSEWLDIDVPAYSLKDKMPQADVVIVTSFYYYNQIKKDLDSLVDCPIVSIENIISDLIVSRNV